MKPGICSLQGSSREAFRESAKLASETFAEVPTKLDGKISEPRASYEPTEHVVVGGQNMAVMEERGPTEYPSAFDALAGPGGENATALPRTLKEIGVSTCIAAISGHAAPADMIRGVAEARSAK